MLNARMSYVLTPPPPASVSIAGQRALFPVRRVFCVGRNYADHVREMGADPKSEPPIFFTKPADAVTQAPAVPYPPGTKDLHHEVELVLALGSGGAGIAEADALQCIWGWGVGVDLTRRDLQAAAKKGGAPWDAAKAFDHSAPISPLTPVSTAPAPAEARIWLSVNGAVRQDSNVAQMIWSATEIIAAASRLWTLSAGDLIFTGTPAGVGPLMRGDAVRCGVGDVELTFQVGD
ncbi:MAG: fumarylacetoacetate hydrolase family protein [Hyphomonadaceae bacterium]|nr:fumarylacetoacetate hydrolase family protein [Hyphomonadaceae bacterium]